MVVEGWIGGKSGGIELVKKFIAGRKNEEALKIRK
jgi:hypothetical protein